MHKNQFGITRMNLEHLKTFHVVASLGSFTEAAKALYMTQPAVSQQIQGIEHALRNPLFDTGRTHQKLSNEPRYRSPFIGDLTRGTF